MKLPGLKNIRKIYGFTMRDLAKRLNVTANAVNLWENGSVDVPESRLRELASFFRLDKELLLKDNHDMKDLMFIEIARAEFKLDDYKLLIKEDKESIDSIIEESEKELDRKVTDLIFRAKEGEDHYYCLKTLLEKVVEVYSQMPFDEYDDFDSLLRNMLDDIIEETDKWKKFDIMYGCLTESEDMDFFGEDYSLKCDVDDLLEKQIRDNIEQLYKIKMYKEGKYKPCWRY